MLQPALQKRLCLLVNSDFSKMSGSLFGDEIIFLVCSWSCEITLASDASGSSILNHGLIVKQTDTNGLKDRSCKSLKPIFVGRENEDHSPASHVRWLPQVPTLTKAGRFAIRCQVQIVIQTATEETA